MSRIEFFFQEVANVRRILAPTDFRRWLRILWQQRGAVLRQRSLGSVDECFGESFTVWAGAQPLRFEGASFGVVREIFGRECYIAARDLVQCETILDLGANAGVFSVFAATYAPQARGYAVEAQPEFIPILEQNFARNRVADRIRIEHALVGGVHDVWSSNLLRRHPGVIVFPILARLEEMGTCDFVKCDVEGAEFRLLVDDRRWLKRVRRVALEYHGSWDDGAHLAETLRSEGFDVKQAAHGSLGYLFGNRS